MARKLLWNEQANNGQNICADLTRGSLGIDKAILACVFHFIEEFCPKENSDDNLIINLKTLRWRLDDVVFDWGASPPPPPPSSTARTRTCSRPTPRAWSSRARR